MKRIFRNLAFISAILFTTNIFALETVCYKNGLDTPSQIESAMLEGGLCMGKVTVNDMLKQGWQILDINVSTENGKLNYSYYFYQNAKQGLSSGAYASQYGIEKKEFSITPMAFKVENINNNQSIINKGNLIIGQSGIVVHIYDNDRRIIVANAKVISSDENSSTIEYFAFNDLEQKAIPTTNRVVENGDILLLNYMYDQSLLIAPDFNSYKAVKDDFAQNNFIHPDLFGASLKFNNQPLPRAEDFQKFAISQNLGTIFFVVSHKIYILDAKTFTILDTYNFHLSIPQKQMPFFTRVEDIKGPLIDIQNLKKLPIISDIFGTADEEEVDNSNYDTYYKQVLGVK